MKQLLKKGISFGLFVTLLSFGAIAGGVNVVAVGDKAPEFTAKTYEGKEANLSDYQGKYVVLEWTNKGCPFVVKHYDESTNMQDLQKKWTAKNVVWLSVISSAEGEQGYVTADEAMSYLKEKGASPTNVFLDPTGEIGKKYGAKTTPHMFVIDPEGKIIYQGAIDSKGGTSADEIPSATNYVSAALEEAMAGKKVTTSETNPYGCSVKYAK